MKRPRLFITRKDVKTNSSMVITDIRGNSKSANWQDFMDYLLNEKYIDLAEYDNDDLEIELIFSKATR